jgi:hypothetical protein
MTENPNAAPVKGRGFSGEIPITVVAVIEQEAEGVIHGTVSLTLHIRDGCLARFTTSRECSFLGDGRGEF